MGVMLKMPRSTGDTLVEGGGALLVVCLETKMHPSTWVGRKDAAGSCVTF